MHFRFTEEQQQFGDVVAEVLQASCTPTDVRAAWTAEAGRLDRRLWDLFGELGLAVAMVDESSGGLGLDERDVVLAFEQLGYHAAPLPLVESILVAPTLLDGLGGGELVTTDLGGELVTCAADADRLLLLTDNRSEVRSFRNSEVTIRPHDSVDGARRLASVDVLPGCPGELVTSDPARIELASDRGAFGTAAVLIGLAQRMLDMTVAYATERRQFGVSIGSFQAIKHHCANALVEISFARPVVHRAACALATDSATRHRDVAQAKAMADMAAQRVGRLALQCHGAIAYTVEYDLHLYLKRANALAATWGSTTVHRATVARMLNIA